MKKMLLAVSMAFAATAAQADITSTDGLLTITGEAVEVLTPSDGGWGAIQGSAEGSYTQGWSGTLNLNAANEVIYTYLGKVAGFDNQFTAQGTVLADDVENASIVVDAAAGALDFGFSSDEYTGSGNFASGAVSNGDANTPVVGILFFDASAYNLANNTDFDFLIGYNDPADINADYDDMVVGVNAVPVPAALPLMASALGMFGIARRRKAA